LRYTAHVLHLLVDWRAVARPRRAAARAGAISRRWAEL